MRQGVKGLIVGALALTGVALATADAQAMPAPSLGSPAVSGTTSLEKVWYRGGYGWRGGFRGYGWRGGYGYRGWGWRRPLYGYGYGWRRPYWGWRRW